MLSNNGKLYTAIAMHHDNAIETAHIKTTKRSTLGKEWIELMGYFILRLPTPILTDSRQSALPVTTYSGFWPTQLVSILPDLSPPIRLFSDKILASHYPMQPAGE
jgi:hypothetical protein